MIRTAYASGGPWEETYGYSRAVRVGGRVVVAGCTSVVEGAVACPGDAGAQLGVALDTAEAALRALGAGLADVVRTRMYVVRREDVDAVGRMHGHRFASVRPASTMVLVAGLLDEAMLVEVEVEAVVPDAEPGW